MMIVVMVIMYLLTYILSLESTASIDGWSDWANCVDFAFGGDGSLFQSVS